MIKGYIAYSVSSDWKFKVTKARGNYIWDEDGRKIIDFTSGWNVANLGWNNKEVNEAVISQINKNTYTPGWTSTSIQEEYAKTLISSLPKPLNSVFRATGGTEANEVALKIAWTATGRKKIIGFADTYHGQSLAVMTMGFRPENLPKTLPRLNDFVQLEFPSEEGALEKFSSELESILKSGDVAAVFTEPGIITGWGSIRIAPTGFLKVIRKLTKAYGALLILDEVGTGFSRCGKLFCMQLAGVVPDIATFAKGMSNGAMPIGAVVSRRDLAEAIIKRTSFYSTFGWTPPACAAALATLRIHQRDRLWEKAKKDGNYLLKILERELSNRPEVKDIRGIGMEIGIQFVSEVIAKKVISKAWKNGLHLIYGDEGNIQLMPPLTTPREVLQDGLKILVQTIEDLTS